MSRFLLALSLAFSSSSCGVVNGGLAYFQSLDHFVEYVPDTGVFVEEGAQALAQQVVALLPEAVVRIARQQYRPFSKQINIYVCATSESFSKYSGASAMARGAVFNEKLFISPKARETKTTKGIIEHELSHLHFQQQVGNSRYASNVPPWFQEGLAVYVSDGAGAERVSIEQAQESIVSGRSFEPNETGSILFPKTAFSFGLKPHMFYRQSALFIRFLKEENEPMFKKLITLLQQDNDFAKAFERAYYKPLTRLWLEFVDTL